MIGLVRAGSEFYVDIQYIDKMQTDPRIGLELPQQTSQLRMAGDCVQPVFSGRVRACPALCLVTLNSPIGTCPLNVIGLLETCTHTGTNSYAHFTHYRNATRTNR